MKKIIFDMNPLGCFALSCIAYIKYFKLKFNKDIYIYTRCENNKYIRIDSFDKKLNLLNRVITYIDLGKEVEEIPFDDNIRVAPIDETYESDEILQDIVKELGDDASWKNSKLCLIEVEDSF